MAKVHPQALVSSSPSSPTFLTSKQETFTIWMKSLVLNGKGCTVFNSNGHIVFRVDNYNSKCSDEVHLMDSEGHVLFTILKKKFKLFRCWEGYRSNKGSESEHKKPGFQVRKAFKVLRWASPCKAVLGLDMNKLHHYKIESWRSKSTCKIVDEAGGLIAEVKRKQLTSGVVLGEDVLTMVVEPHIDHSLVMALVIVHNLLNCKM